MAAEADDRLPLSEHAAQGAALQVGAAQVKREDRQAVAGTHGIVQAGDVVELEAAAHPHVGFPAVAVRQAPDAVVGEQVAEALVAGQFQRRARLAAGLQALHDHLTAAADAADAG